MGAYIDLTGKVVGSWTVIKRASNLGTVTRWLCRCACGVEREVRAIHLMSGASSSCGCVAPVRSPHGQSTNGMTKKYKTWRYMKARCCNPKHKNADIYAGLLCDRWLDFKMFNDDMPEPPSDGHTIDRIDNSKGYEPGNVRWVLMAEQHRNQRNCRWIEFNGKRKLLSEWARELGISSATLSGRIDRWGVEKALTVQRGKRVAPAHNKLSITRNGVTDTLTGWANRLGVSPSTMHKRIKNGKF